MHELQREELRLARELARLRAELVDLGADAPEQTRRIAALARALTDLQADLARLRAEQQTTVWRGMDVGSTVPDS